MNGQTNETIKFFGEERSLVETVKAMAARIEVVCKAQSLLSTGGKALTALAEINRRDIEIFKTIFKEIAPLVAEELADEGKTLPDLSPWEEEAEDAEAEIEELEAEIEELKKLFEKDGNEE